MNMPKSREFQAKIPSPKAIFIGFLLVTVKVLNSYELFNIDFPPAVSAIVKGKEIIGEVIGMLKNKVAVVTG